MYFKSELDNYSAEDYFGKSFEVTGPGELRLYVDYDDVPHPTVAVLAQQMVAILNAHWVPITARMCAEPEKEDFDDEHDECFHTVLPLDGPDRCPHCGGGLKKVDLD